MRRASTRGPRPLDVYKKLTILRTTDDCIVDEAGTKQSITAHDLERDVAAAPVIISKKLNIPIPVGAQADDYETRIPGGYEPPVSYIRLVKKVNDDEDAVEYVLEHADMEWLRSCGHASSMLDQDRLERMIDELEKATGANLTPISQDAAEGVLNTKLGITASSASREVIADVYQYWLQKRALLKKPLLRRLWPLTSVTDTNPHHTFRAIVRERYKLRRNRKNDMESFRRMQQLRRECELMRDLLDLVRHREKVKALQVTVGEAAFQQQFKDMDIELQDAKPPIDVSQVSQLLQPPPLGEDATLQRMARMKKLDTTDTDLLDDSNLDDARDLNGTFRIDAIIKPPPALPSFMNSMPYCLPSTNPSPSPWPRCLKPRLNSYSGEPRDETKTEADSSDVFNELSYECRGRMGRCGRIIIDRVPSHHPPSQQLYGAPIRSKLPLHHFPTQFPKSFAPEYSHASTLVKSLTDTPVTSSSLNTTNNMGGFTSKTYSKQVGRYDKRKLEEIYDRSDSEDEELRPLHGAPLPHGASIKFQVTV